MRFGRFSGTHPTMGVQHGEAFRDLLQQCRQGLDDLSPDKRLSVDSLIPHFESVLSQVAPALIEEMQGIAQGSGPSYKMEQSGLPTTLSINKCEP